MKILACARTKSKLVTAFEADEVHDLQAGKTELLGDDFLEVVLDAELLRVLFGSAVVSLVKIAKPVPSP